MAGGENLTLKVLGVFVHRQARILINQKRADREEHAGGKRDSNRMHSDPQQHLPGTKLDRSGSGDQQNQQGADGGLAIADREQKFVYGG